MNHTENKSLERVKQEQIRYRKKYLVHADEFKRSGWSGTSRMWRKAREIILEAVEEDGFFLDVGCANGILVRDLRKWAKETKGVNLIPYGIDFIEELLLESKIKNSGFEENFKVTDMMDFNPRKKFTFIRTEFYGPHNNFKIFIKKYINMLAPNGRLIFTFYDSENYLFKSIDERIREMGPKFGYSFLGSAEVPRVTHVVWVEKSREEKG